MDDKDIDEIRHGWSDDAGEVHAPHGQLAENAPTSGPPLGATFASRPNAPIPESSVRRPGVNWVRASDLLNTSTARIAGRSIDFEAELARRLRRAPATTGRNIRDRADRLPPLSAFGQSPERSQVSRSGLERR